MIEKLDIIKDKEHDALQDLLLQLAEKINEIIDWINKIDTDELIIQRISKSINSVKLPEYPYKNKFESQETSSNNSSELFTSKEPRPDIFMDWKHKDVITRISQVRKQTLQEVKKIFHSITHGNYSGLNKRFMEKLKELEGVR